jgi:hypothetical protein
LLQHASISPLVACWTERVFPLQLMGSVCTCFFEALTTIYRFPGATGIDANTIGIDSNQAGNDDGPVPGPRIDAFVQLAKTPGVSSLSLILILVSSDVSQ